MNKPGGECHARLDAGLAAAASPHHRPCRQVPRRAQGRHAFDRRPNPRDQLRGDPRAGARWRNGWRRTASSSATVSATLAWNTWRHLEAWYGILGIGAIYHTVNPRLFPDQIAWIVNHAEDRMMIADLTFVPILEKLADKLPTIERYVVLTDAAHMPKTTLEERGRLRRLDRRCRRRFRMEELRREYRRRHVLHVGHHRQSQGRGLLAPLQRAACLHGGAARLQRSVVA